MEIVNKKIEEAYGDISDSDDDETESSQDDKVLGGMSEDEENGDLDGGDDLDGLEDDDDEDDDGDDGDGDKDDFHFDDDDELA